MTIQLYPLEQVLFYAQKFKKSEFPESRRNYYDVYSKTKELFSAKYYPEIEKIANLYDFKDGKINYYNNHGIFHINTLIDLAGKLLGLPSDVVKATKSPISGYEAYLTLMTILAHDVGMIYGREDHEKRAIDVFASEKEQLKLTQPEIITICDIASAHSGKSHGVPTDTLGHDNLSCRQQSTNSNVVYNAKAIAALVRFADEISDNKERASFIARIVRDISGLSKLCHNYCEIIDDISFNHSDHVLQLTYAVNFEDLLTHHSVGDSCVLLVDYMSERLAKLNIERIYCCRHTIPWFYISRIDVHVYVFKYDTAEKVRKSVLEYTLQLGDLGYPEADDYIKRKHPEFEGVTVFDQVVGMYIPEL